MDNILFRFSGEIGELKHNNNNNLFRFIVIGGRMLG